LIWFSPLDVVLFPVKSAMPLFNAGEMI